MPDVFTKSKRSEVMSRIRSRGNKATELELAKIFRLNGITGWRRGRKLRFRKKLKAENLTTGAWGCAGKIQRVLDPTGDMSRGEGVKAEGGQTRIIRPDFVFRRLGLAVFVDGCYWHGCPQHATKPRTNAAFWRKKFAANKARDLLVNRTLRKAGWRVVRIWEHELKKTNVHRAQRKLRAAGLVA